MPPRLTVLAQDRLPPAQRAEIVALCDAAFAEPFDRLFDLLPGAVHLLAHEGAALVGHACWVERRLYPEGAAPLRAAYVEAVATLPARQGTGIGTTLMRRVAEEIAAYDVGALSPATPGFYERLGWLPWRGPTAIRMGDALVPTPGEEIMVLPTPASPPLNLDAPIAADWRPGEVW